MEHLTFNIRSSRRNAVVAGAGRTSSAGDPASPRFARVRRTMAPARYHWDYLWTLAFTALLFFRPQDHVPALVSLHLAELTAIAGLSAMALRRLATGQTITKINPEVVGVILLGVVVLATTPFSFWPGGSFAVFTEIYIKIILIFALMISTITTPRRLQQMTWLMILASGYIAGRGVLDYLSGVNLIEGDRLRGAVGGIFRNPNDLALNLVTFLAPTLFVVIQEKRTPQRLLAALVAVLMLTATVFTKSRSGFLGLVAMTTVVAYYTARIKPGLVFAVVLAGLVALPATPPSFWNRMGSITNADEDKSGSRAARIRLLNQAIDVFADHPLTGIGAGQFQNYDAPGMVERWRVTHNVWLQVAADLGIFGLVTFGFLVVRAYTACFWTLRRLRRPLRRWHADADPGVAIDSSRLDRQLSEQPAINRQPGLKPSGVNRPAAVETRGSTNEQQSGSIGSDERRILDMNARSMLAGLVGWTICAMFASVAFNWTFYYVLALAVAGREIVASRLAGTVPETGTRREPRLVRAPA
jgi:putative inorganic carbon (HCO3(-)) transporter